MTARKDRIQEIERVLLEDAEKADAWSSPMRVPASRSPRPGWYGQSKHLELAAKFFVLSILHRLGSEATLTLAQPTDVDIAAVLPSGEALTIQLKTLTGSTNWWVDRFRVRKHHFVAFVCFQEPVGAVDPAATPQLYIWSSQRLQSFLRQQKKKSVSLDVLASRHSPSEALECFAVRKAG